MKPNIHPLFAKGYTHWDLVQSIAPRSIDSPQQLDSQARAWALAKGLSLEETERIVAIKRAGAELVRNGGENKASVDCTWDENKLHVRRQFLSVMRQSGLGPTGSNSELFCGQDYVSFIPMFRPGDAVDPKYYVKVIPRGSTSERIIFTNLFDRFLLSNMDLTSIYPEGTYSAHESNTTTQLTRLFSVPQDTPGLRVRADFSNQDNNLLRISLLSPTGVAYEDARITWGDYEGTRRPIKILKTLRLGDGSIRASETWTLARSSRDREVDHRLAKVLVRGESIMDCRFGQDQCVNYPLPSNELPPDSFVSGLLKNNERLEQKKSLVSSQATQVVVAIAITLALLLGFALLKSATKSGRFQR